MKQNQFFEKINNINKSLAKLSWRGKRPKLIKIRPKKSDIRPDVVKNKEIIGHNTELENLNYKDAFVDIYDLLKFKQFTYLTRNVIEATEVQARVYSQLDFTRPSNKK